MHWPKDFIAFCVCVCAQIHAVKPPHADSRQACMQEASINMHTHTQAVMQEHTDIVQTHSVVRILECKPAGIFRQCGVSKLTGERRI